MSSLKSPAARSARINTSAGPSSGRRVAIASVVSRTRRSLSGKSSSSLLAKYAKNVRLPMSAAAAMSATVVSS